MQQALINKPVASSRAVTTCQRQSVNHQRVFTSGRPAHISSRKQCAATVQKLNVRVNSSSTEPKTDDTFVPVIRPEDLPKGSRKEVRVNGKGVLLFWYRNQIYAIESRSPAEGAYSEGFINAKFTQDYAIECPSTGTLFSLKDGSILDWYPNNPVLRVLTPQDTCRPMEIYPVKLMQDAIAVDVTGGAGLASNNTKGGSDTSLENNNVYGLEPKVYVEGSTEDNGANAAGTILTGIAAVIAVAGIIASAYALFIFANQ